MKVRYFDVLQNRADTTRENPTKFMVLIALKLLLESFRTCRMALPVTTITLRIS
jgi:hypothetical protein